MRLSYRSPRGSANVELQEKRRDYSTSVSLLCRRSRVSSWERAAKLSGREVRPFSLRPEHTVLSNLKV